jgi:hypothetical protein
VKRDLKKRWWLVMRLRNPNHRTQKNSYHWFESMHGPREGWESHEWALEGLEEIRSRVPDRLLQYKITTKKPS